MSYSINPNLKLKSALDKLLDDIENALKPKDVKIDPKFLSPIDESDLFEAMYKVEFEPTESNYDNVGKKFGELFRCVVIYKGNNEYDLYGKKMNLQTIRIIFGSFLRGRTVIINENQLKEQKNY